LLDPIEHAVLHAGTAAALPGGAVRVVINEAVALSKRFGATDGYRCINGVLDRGARPGEHTSISAASQDPVQLPPSTTSGFDRAGGTLPRGNSDPAICVTVSPAMATVSSSAFPSKNGTDGSHRTHTRQRAQDPRARRQVSHHQ
jgi:hypothetical protein